MKYLHEVLALDMQTSSFINDGVKVAIPYTFHIQWEDVHYGLRTQDEFLDFIEGVILTREITIENRMVIYTHNLPKVFMHMKRLFLWDAETVFAMSTHNNVIRAVTESGVEFRCSEALTGLNMEKLIEYVGMKRSIWEHLDTEKIRHSETELDDLELSFIKTNTEAIVQLVRLNLTMNSMRNIPSTVTGHLRKEMRSYVNKSKQYKNKMKKLNLTVDNYYALKSSFIGGYTHANEDFIGKENYNVVSFDAISQYVSAMLQFTFPMGEGVDVTYDAIANPEYLAKSLIGKYHFTINLTFKNVVSKNKFPDVQIKDLEEYGEIVSDEDVLIAADWITLTLNDVTMRLFDDNYKYESYKIEEVIRYNADFLPKEVIEYVLSIFKSKSELKDVLGKSDEYNMAKVKLNSIYGIMASDPIMREFILDEDSSIIDEIRKDKDDIIEAIGKHNKSRNRFLYYPWGIWVSSYARTLLNQFRRELDDAGVEDYYCDTDSKFVKNDAKVYGIVEKINSSVDQRIKYVCDYYGLNFEDTRPLNNKGEAQPLGHWIMDGHYSVFKPLGPKRYATMDLDGKFAITVSGLDKVTGGAYIESQGGIKEFSDMMYIPKEHTGRHLAVYSEDSVMGEAKDYNGIIVDFYTQGHVHITKEDFGLSLFDKRFRQIKNETGLDFEIWKEFIQNS